MTTKEPDLSTRPISDLIGLLRSSEPTVVMAAAIALEKRGRSAGEAILELAKAWTDAHHENADVLETIRHALCEIARNAKSWLSTAIEHEDFPCELVYTMYQAGIFEDDTAALILAVRKDLAGHYAEQSPEFCLYPDFLETLGDVGDERAVPVLVKAMETIERDQVMDYCGCWPFTAVVRALEKMGPAAAPAMPCLLKHVEMDISQLEAGKWIYCDDWYNGITAPSANIMGLLAAIGEEAHCSIPLLLQLYGLVNHFPHEHDSDQEPFDDDPTCACTVLDRIASALHTMGCATVLRAIRCLASTSHRESAFRDLCAEHPALGIFPLADIEEALNSENKDVQVSARDALLALIRRLQTDLDDDNERTRESAIKRISQIRTLPGVTVPILAGALADTSLKVRLAAASGLGTFGRRAIESLPPLLEWTRSENPDTRFRAACAIMRIDEKREEALVPVLLESVDQLEVGGRSERAEGHFLLAAHWKDRDDGKYRRFLRRAADNGHHEANFLLGLDQVERQFPDRSPDYYRACLHPDEYSGVCREALEALEIAANRDYPPAYAQFAWALEREGRRSEALEWYRKSLRGKDLDEEHQAVYRFVTLAVSELGCSNAAKAISGLGFAMPHKDMDIGWRIVSEECGERCKQKGTCEALYGKQSVLEFALAFVPSSKDPQSTSEWLMPVIQLADSGWIVAERVLGEYLDDNRGRAYLCSAAKKGDKRALYFLSVAVEESLGNEECSEPLRAIYPVVDLLLSEAERGCDMARARVRSIIENVSTWISGHLEDHASLRDEKEQSDRELECLRTAQKTGVEEWEKAGCPKGRIHDFIEQAECRLG